jgi:hypothetical protein
MAKSVVGIAEIVILPLLLILVVAPLAAHGEIGGGHGRDDNVISVERAPLAPHGGDHTSEDRPEQGDNITLVERGTSATYLAARLKRDHPEIATQLAAGQPWLMASSPACLERHLWAVSSLKTATG